MARFGNHFSFTMFGWVFVVWLMLWGSISVSIVVFGIAVAFGVLVFFPLPRVRTRTFNRPFRLFALACYLAVDLVLSAVRVSIDTIRYGARVRAVVVAVPILSDVDYEIASAANMISLAPGKFVLQIDRTERIFYVYSLGVHSRTQLVRMHNGVLDLQVRVIKVFGEANQIEHVAEQADRARRKQPVQEAS